MWEIIRCILNTSASLSALHLFALPQEAGISIHNGDCLVKRCLLSVQKINNDQRI